jgi:aryl-alcohol dehydrogenase-like predicted oxidoreductase
METTTLGPEGPRISALALGGASLGGVYRPVSQADADATVAAALEAGVNLIDVAPYYGQTRAETALGQALRGVARDRHVLMTKVGRYGDDEWDFSRDRVLREFDASLKRLGVDHVDVLQCHDIEHGDHRQLLDEALPALRALKAQGVIGRIGITGYDLAMLESVATTEQVDTVMAYCTFTLQDRRLGAVARRLNAAGIAVFNASPLGMGLLTDRGPPAWHPGLAEVKAAAAEAAVACRAAGSDIASTALSFAFDAAPRNGMASTVVGMASPEHVRRNLQAFAAKPDPAALAAAEAALAPVRDLGWDKAPDA